MKLKLRSRVRFFAALFAGTGTAVRRTPLAAYVDLDYSKLNEATSFDPADSYTAVYHPSTGLWEKVSMATVQNAGQSQQIVTSGAVVNVAAADGLIAVNKTVGSATVVNLPLASAKIGPVKVSDFKGDASTNNIQVKTTGSNVFPGGLTTWTLSADTASLVFTPLKDGTGYAI